MNDQTMDSAPGGEQTAQQAQGAARVENRRWWVKLFVQPVLLLAAGALLMVALGAAQKAGWISAGSMGTAHTASSGGEATRYICPMMCTPPQTEPGRCPVCAMELVAATSGGAAGGERSIQIDPAARRLAHIQTVAVQSLPLERTIRAVGELSYDEGSLKTISAYVNGRLDRLYADYTGVVVAQGDQLALLYSPQLYAAQVELLAAKKLATSQAGILPKVAEANRELHQQARQRLIEWGMTREQVEQLEWAGSPNSRLHLYAPISGTVIEKMAVEGDYVKEGDAIYRLADLSTVWLMIRLFPEDAATVRFGQRVEAEVRSLPGRKFTGRVAFIDPKVDPKTRTVGVRVVIPNQDGILRVGDYAKAAIEVPLADAEHEPVYDPELANKWISPRHPHIIQASPGQCPICGVELVPAAHFGFSERPSSSNDVLVVPRDAVLMAGSNSVVYVETEPGRFELRHVSLGPGAGDGIVIRSGLKPGEQVAVRGNFLIDSQMQLAGNPSLIDPMKAQPKLDEEPSTEVLAALAALSEEDRALAERQRVCPVANFPLGSMGTPPKVEVAGRTVFLCCDGCREALLEDPQKFLAMLDGAPTAGAKNPPLEVELPPIGDIELVPQLRRENEEAVQ